ncbi:glycoside hydrolase family 32 protein [Clostridium oryzae]|uniref:Sucrose-6-phosphate hydrolase n=1 Tax=Clostridium oryzae TaxID=1450648 RepID=A0A1V4IRT6_9CLOT|nr:glycoside hydrolase family 32 protein [Clostridium oryzae]OPJ62530.1 sucrose-6-phosphate hydrolase [Clostridium oryzae]
MDKLSKAREYIKENKNKINQEYRLKYHFMSEIGWINDPNGFSYYNGEYHLFYQYYPYGSYWGSMHWGHAKSKDLIKWDYLPVALAPDMNYDADGCFSGTAIEIDGKLYLMYTGNISPNPDKPENIRQLQNIAVSDDGIEFTKFINNPVIDTKDLPSNALPQDFRDPKVLRKGDSFYAIIASRNTDGSGQLLVYKSNNLSDWTYLGVLLKSENKLGEMWECPDLFKIGDTDVVIISPQYIKRQGDKYCNTHSCVYILGKGDIETCNYTTSAIDEIDGGFDFYAPQTLQDDNGRQIMIAWIQMWERRIPTNEENHGWAGAMTLPRELRVINNKLYQIPVEEIKKYRTNLVKYSDISFENSLSLKEIEGQNIELDMKIDFLEANIFGLKILKGEQQETIMYYDKEKAKFVFDRSKSGVDISDSKADEDIKYVRKVGINLIENKLKLRIFVDRISVEIFIQDGEKVITSTVYPKSASRNIEFFSDGEVLINELNKWKIVL